MNSQNSIDIRQAPLENYEITKAINSYEEFSDALHLQGITTLPDPKLKIEQDKGKYFFSFGNNTPSFHIFGEKRFTAYMQDFLNDKITNAQTPTLAIAQIETNKTSRDISLKFTIAETQDEINLLRNMLAQQNIENNKIMSLPETKTRIATLMAEYLKLDKQATANQRFRKPGDKLEKLKREKQKDELEKDIRVLKRLENQTNAFMSAKAEDPISQRQTLVEINASLDDLSNKRQDFVQQRNDIVGEKDTGDTYYNLRTYTQKDANKLNSLTKKEIERLIKLDKTELAIGQKEQRLQDLKELNSYLEKVIAGTVNPATEKFTQKHLDAFNYLVTIDPTLKNESTDKKTEVAAALTPEQLKQQEEANKAAEAAKNSSKTTAENGTTTPGDSKGWAETFKEKGLKGSLRKIFDIFPNMNNGAKDNWTNLLVIGGVGVGVRTLGKWLFTGKFGKKESTTKRRQRALIAGGVTLGFNLFGTNPFKFTKEIIGGGIDLNQFKMQWPRAKKEQQESTENQLTTSELVSVLGTSTVGSLGQWIDKKTFKFKGDGYTNGYNQLLANFQNDPAKRAIIEKIGKDDPNGMLKKALATIGITPENIDTIDQNTKIEKIATIYGTNRQAAEDYLVNKQLERVPGKESVEQTLLNGGKLITTADLDTLIEKGVYRAKEGTATHIDTAEDKAKKKALTDKIDAIAPGTSIEKGNIKIAIETFYDGMPTTNKAIDIKEAPDGKGFLFSTYGKETLIRLGDKSIAGFNNAFPSYIELFKSANLSNYIKKVFADKQPVKNTSEPFSKSLLGNIQFDDADRWNPIDGKTDVVSGAIFGRRGGALKDISPILEAKKQEYINYLNSQKFWKGATGTATVDGKPDTIRTTLATGAAGAAAAGAAGVDSDLILGGNGQATNKPETKPEVKPTKPHDADIPDDVETPEDQTTNLTEIGKLRLSPEEIKRIKQNWLEAYKQNPHWKDLGAKLSANGEMLTLTTYGKPTTIDFGERAKQQGDQIKDLNVKFADYAELFRVANLNNFIRDTFEKNNPDPKDIAKPFYLLGGLFDIKFNDRDSFWNTTVVGATVPYWGTLEKVSPTLARAGNKDLFVEYINKQRLGDRVPGLSYLYTAGLTQEGVRESFEGFQNFYKDLKDQHKNIVFTKTGGGEGKRIAERNSNNEFVGRKATLPVSLSMKTRGWETPLDLKDKKIPGLDIKFGTTEEVFKTNDLINQIFSICKTKTANSETPFNISRPGGDLEFNDVNFNTWFDQEYASKDYMKGKSEQFDNRANRLLLVDYLNKARKEKINKVAS